MPKLDWISKRYVVDHADEVSFRLLQKVPEASEGAGKPGEAGGNGGTSSESMIVQGDNLKALKSPIHYYHRRIKLVFTDPSYNTGNGIWAYNDRMNTLKLKDWLHRIFGGEGEKLSRQDKVSESVVYRIKVEKVV